MGKGHEHNKNSLHLPRRHAAAEAAEAATPEATEATTAAPRRVARYAVDARSRAPRAFQARPPSPSYSRIMLAPPRTLPIGFIAPCLPTKAHTLPSGSDWLHEIKHDGFRIIARKNGAQVRLYSRPGNDFTRRFPLIVETLARLRALLHYRRRSCRQR